MFECAKQSAVALSHLLDNVNTNYADFIDIVKWVLRLCRGNFLERSLVLCYVYDLHR